jgi:hypothetical protein
MGPPVERTPRWPATIPVTKAGRVARRKRPAAQRWGRLGSRVLQVRVRSCSPRIYMDALRRPRHAALRSGRAPPAPSFPVGCLSGWAPCAIAHRATLRSRDSDTPAVSTDLLGIGLNAVWCCRFGIRRARFGERMLFARWAVADALERAIPIRRARLIYIGTDKILSIFILPGRPARLADVHK